MLRPQLEAADRLLQPGDLLLLGHVLLLLALQLELPLGGVRRVVARPDPDPAAVELGDLGHRLVQQVAIVRDHDDGAVEAADQPLQPAARLGVEVRLGLVEQQQVGLRGEARPPARSACAGRRCARRRAGRSPPRPGPARSSSDPPAALEGVAAGLLELLEQHLPGGAAPAPSGRGRRPAPDRPGAAPTSSSSLLDPLQVGPAPPARSGAACARRARPAGAARAVTMPRRRATCRRPAGRRRAAAAAGSTCRCRSRRSRRSGRAPRTSRSRPSRTVRAPKVLTRAERPSRWIDDPSENRLGTARRRPCGTYCKDDERSK